MPTELFESLIRNAFLTTGWAQLYAGRIKNAGLPDNFVEQLESISSSYIPLLREQHGIEKRFNQLSATERALVISRLAVLERELCSARYAALTAAQARFGPALDNLLYGPIARALTIYFDQPADATTLRQREKGCR